MSAQTSARTLDIIRSKDLKGMCALARDEATAPEVLAMLARAESKSVRAMVAANRATSYRADVALCGDGAEEVRAALAGRLAREANHRLCSPEAGEIRHALLLRLANDGALKVREFLALGVAQNDASDFDFAVLLARDPAQSVRDMILRRARLFNEADLCAFLTPELGEDDRISIARRPGLTDAAATRVIETGGEAAIIALIENHEAKISPALIEDLVEISPVCPAIGKALSFRPGVPLRLRSELAKMEMAQASARTHGYDGHGHDGHGHDGNGYDRHSQHEDHRRDHHPRRDGHMDTARDAYEPPAAANVNIPPYGAPEHFAPEHNGPEHQSPSYPAPEPRAQVHQPHPAHSAQDAMTEEPGEDDLEECQWLLLRVERAVSDAIADGSLSEKMITAAAMDGSDAFVWVALAQLVGTNHLNVRRVLASRAPRTIMALCWRAGLSPQASAVIQHFAAGIAIGACLEVGAGSPYPFERAQIGWLLSPYDIDALGGPQPTPLKGPIPLTYRLAS